jgi:acyl-CoA dehydrogenase
MLAEMIQRLFERSLDSAAQAQARDGGWLANLWAEATEMGLPLALLSEEQGGFGLTAAEQGEALTLLGKLAVPLPLAETDGRQPAAGQSRTPAGRWSRWPGPGRSSDG